MKKSDFNTLAVMGIACGVLLASQDVAVASTATALGTLLAASCGGYSNSNGGYYQNSCGGQSRYNNGRGYSRNNWQPQGEMDEGSISEENQPPSSSCSGKQSCNGMNKPSAPAATKPGVAQPSSCSGKQSCNGMSKPAQPGAQPSTAQPQQMTQQNSSGLRNTSNANGATSFQDNAAKRADLNSR